MKRSLLSSVALVALGGAASAQVNVVPQVGVNIANLRANTYTASSAQLVPAASATDIFCVNGSTSKNIHIRRFIISGTAGTAINTPVLINYNHSLDSGGTAATSLAAPVAVGLDPGNPVSAVAATTAYTGNPTVNDSAPNLLAAVSVSFPVTTTAISEPTYIHAGGYVDPYEQSWNIPKASAVVAQICLNLDGKSISSGVLNITAEWTED